MPDTNPDIKTEVKSEEAVKPASVPQTAPATKSTPNGLVGKILTWAGTAYDISLFGGVRWDGDRRETFFVDKSGKQHSSVAAPSVDQYRAIEALCLPYWRANGQSIE